MDNRQWVDSPSATPPSLPASPSAGYPSYGNPSTPTPGTLLDAWWLHAVGEEIRNAIEAGGLTPDYETLDQLATSITNQISAATGGSVFPAGTVVLFCQDAAPTGWTQITTGNADNRYLRVVNDGTGGATGGTDSPTTGVNKVFSHTHEVSGDTGVNSVNHTHDYFTVEPGNFVAASGGTGWNLTAGHTTTGENTAHTHHFSVTSGNPDNSGTIIFRYTNVIMCSYDG